MKHREQVAHHEAAHIIVSKALGGSIPPEGINLNAESSVPGAFGHANASIFPDDPNLSMKERQAALMDSLIVTCAGAASDAKVTGSTLSNALEKQPGDTKVANDLLDNSPIVEGAKLKRLLLKKALELAEKYLEMPFIWEVVERVARMALDADGRLSGADIEGVYTTAEANRPEAKTT